jgi:hypothetical protein
MVPDLIDEQRSVQALCLFSTGAGFTPSHFPLYTVLLFSDLGLSLPQTLLSLFLSLSQSPLRRLFRRLVDLDCVQLLHVVVEQFLAQRATAHGIVPRVTRHSWGLLHLGPGTRCSDPFRLLEQLFKVLFGPLGIRSFPLAKLSKMNLESFFALSIVTPKRVEPPVFLELSLKVLEPRARAGHLLAHQRFVVALRVGLLLAGLAG